MARAGCRPSGLQKLESDDVEKSIELLDKVLSEFEDPDSLPHIEPESPSQGNQSEDDGYMSMNGRRAKILVPPDFHQPSEELLASPPVMAQLPVLPTQPEETKSHPPPPEVAEAIISNLLPRSGSTNTEIYSDDSNHINTTRNHLVRQHSQDFSENESPTNYLNGNDRSNIRSQDLAGDVKNDADSTQLRGKKMYANIPETQNPLQATLPKTRPSTVIPSRYSSLPCSGPARLFGSFDGIGGMKGAMGSGSFDGSRNILGIGISAVHDAVLRGGVARLPEPIVNEHPVTIYPGRASPPRTKVPPRTLPGSIERHREVCRNLMNPDPDLPDMSINLSSPLHQAFVITKSPSSPVMIVQQQNGTLICRNNKGAPQLIDKKMLFGNLHIPPRKRTGNGTDSSGIIANRNESSESSEEFSDDSLEGQSLPPPPPPPIVPPPPSLSAPVTPSKRGSIAWEINLDDHLPPPPSAVQSSSSSSSSSMSSKPKNKTITTSKEQATMKFDINTTTSSLSLAKVVPRQRGCSLSGSQSSLASTPANSGGSLSNNHSPQHHNLRHRSGSVEWPDPPEPPICSTEDEAASLYSDSDDVIPIYPANMTGQGTYVIRKGRRERHRLSELNTSMSSSINSRLSSEANSPGVNQISNLFVPNSRFSIDLGVPSQVPALNSLLSPRSRLSLDLSSPNSTTELPQSAHHASASSFMVGEQQQHFTDYKPYSSCTRGPQQKQEIDDTSADDQPDIGNESNSEGVVHTLSGYHGSNSSLNNNHNNSNGSLNGPLTRVSSLPAISQQTPQSDAITTPRRELAPPIEEDEEQDSESQRGAPLRQIENNISALLRGDISVARVGDISHPRRPLGFRPGVHKSESAKEMLLSQTTVFGPLPPSPPSSSPEAEIDGFPPLPPSPQENAADDEDDAVDDVLRGIHGIRITSRTRLKTDYLLFPRDGVEHPPAVPPHRSQPSVNTLKTRSMDAGYTKKYSSTSVHPGGPGTLPGEMPPSSSRRRLMSGAYPKRTAQSPREERRLQTSCSLPETPIFARGCDIPRTPHRRAPELPSGGSRTAPRTNTTTSLNSSIVGIDHLHSAGSTLGGGRQRNLNQALASGEMLRLAGGPARGWYPKQRNTQQRPASTEHLDRLHRSQGSMRAWDSGGMSGGIGGIGTGPGGNRKPLTLPPNLTPKFFNKSPREALRRVTSLLIRKGNGKDKETKRDKEAFTTSAVHRSPGSAGDIPIGQTSNGPTNGTATNHHHKKKGFFKSLWKKSKYYSLEQPQL